MFTERYAHPDKLREAVLSSDPNRMRRSLLTREIRVTWDLYSLGLTILELLDTFAEAHPDGITPYEYRYLRLMGSRALDGHMPERFNAPIKRKVGACRKPTRYSFRYSCLFCCSAVWTLTSLI
jgi:hypothetical protein